MVVRIKSQLPSESAAQGCVYLGLPCLRDNLSLMHSNIFQMGTKKVFMVVAEC